MSTISTEVSIGPKQREEGDDQPNVSPRLCLNLDDFEVAARQLLSERAYSYIHSAADSLQTLTNNRVDWKKISFRPRVLRSVGVVDMKRAIMGHPSARPFFIAPFAMARLAHPEGELCLARAAARANIPLCVSTYASVAHQDLAACLDHERRGGCLLFQLYVSQARERTVELIARAKGLGCKALVVTVDTPVVGKREEDERHQATLDVHAGIGEPPVSFDEDVGQDNPPILRGVHSYLLNWDDLGWIREAWGATTGPLVLKGIQSVEDVQLACKAGVDAVYLSNHGGRQIDDGPSAIRTLLEIHQFYPQAFDTLDIYLDGGVRRGADVLKALCLGARAVALGRPFFYALGVNGTEGAMKVIRSKSAPRLPCIRSQLMFAALVLSDEIETTMRLLGVTSLTQLRPEMVNAEVLVRELPAHLSPFASSRSKL